MANYEDSDDNQEVLSDLVADLSLAQQSSSNNRISNSQAGWLNSTVSSRSTPSLYGAGRPTTQLPRRTSSNRVQTHSVSELDLSHQAGPSSSQIPTVFNTPNRSIFSSGPPTASVSANTAHASMSSPPNNASSHPLSALTAPSISNAKRSASSQPEFASVLRKTRFTGVQKDVDDPSVSIEETTHSRRRGTGTPTAVSRLFAAPEPSPEISRRGSYIRTPSGTQYIKAMSTDTAPLPNHLYTEGLLSGRHSDIVIHAFGHRYPLHRLLLERAPFFRSAFSEPWSESTAKEMPLYPEEIDTNITKTAFELALKRIYGCSRAEEEDREAFALFATGCWLEMADLIEASVHSILRQMTPANICKSIQLATGSYYGKEGNRILAAAKAMLCREGWEMPLRYFDGISGEIVREIIGCDGFYVPTEWNRYVIAKRIFNRRLKAAAIEAGLIDSRGQPLLSMPESMRFMTVRFDAVYRNSFPSGAGNASDSSDAWVAVYTTPDLAPLLVLLDEGIHYMHMTFEQLQRIRSTKDVLGLPLLPEKVISNALWMSMELRQRVVNAPESGLELGIANEIEETEEENSDSSPSDDFSLEKEASARALGKRREGAEPDTDMISGSWDGNGQPRKFWIPITDATYPLGGNLEPVAATAAGPSGHRSRISATLDPQDVQWASDFGSSAQDRPDTPNTIGSVPGPQVSYTHYPPLRFAVEFPAARKLKEAKRSYSSTVWYAGSLWNVYVQKKETHKGIQLGIYLHRERQIEGSGELLASILKDSVNERISNLERESLSGRVGSRRNTDRVHANDDSSSGGDTTLVSIPSQDLGTLSGLLPSQPSNGITKASEASLAPSTTHNFGTDTPRTEDEREDARLDDPRYRVSTLPPYVDGRPTIKTYFKIYTPSKAGRILSVYESAPDKFNFSQSWGWKSSNLVVDDQIGEAEEGRTRDPRLRFMVVIGKLNRRQGRMMQIKG